MNRLEDIIKDTGLGKFLVVKDERKEHPYMKILALICGVVVVGIIAYGIYKFFNQYDLEEFEDDFDDFDEDFLEDEGEGEY